MELFWQCEQKVIWIGFQTNFIAISRNIIPMKLIFFEESIEPNDIECLVFGVLTNQPREI